MDENKLYKKQRIMCPECKTPNKFTIHNKTIHNSPLEVSCDGCGHTILAKKMHNYYEEILPNNCYYSKKCKCGNEVCVLTQENNAPEYRTSVGVVCSECRKEIVWFVLPVN